MIEPAGEADAAPCAARASRFADEPDPLAPLFRAQADGALGAPDLRAADRARAGAAPRGDGRGPRRDRAASCSATTSNVERAEKLAELPRGAAARRPLRELPLASSPRCATSSRVFADVEQLFIRSPRGSVGAASSAPRTTRACRMFVRRMRAGGAGIAPDFLDLLRRALAPLRRRRASTTPTRSSARCCACSRRSAPELRHRLRARAAAPRDALASTRHPPRRRPRARSDALDADRGDARPRLRRGRRRRARGALRDLRAARDRARRPSARRKQARELARRRRGRADRARPRRCCAHLAARRAPSSTASATGSRDADPRRRAIALAAHVRRAVLAGGRSPRTPPSCDGAAALDARALAGDASCSARRAAPPTCTRPRSCCATRAASERDRHEFPARRRARALRAAAPTRADVVALAESVRAALGAALPAGRFTLSLVAPGGPDRHLTFVPSRERPARSTTASTACTPRPRRASTSRGCAKFELERLRRARGPLLLPRAQRATSAGDERIFVLGRRARALARRRPRGRAATCRSSSTRSTRRRARCARILGVRDPQRRLQWNRVTICVAPPVALDRGLAARISQRLAPAMRHLGLEKVMVRLRLLDRARARRGAARRSRS